MKKKSSKNPFIWYLIFWIFCKCLLKLQFCVKPCYNIVTQHLYLQLSLLNRAPTVSTKTIWSLCNHSLHQGWGQKLRCTSETVTATNPSFRERMEAVLMNGSCSTTVIGNELRSSFTERRQSKRTRFKDIEDICGNGMYERQDVVDDQWPQYTRTEQRYLGQSLWRLHAILDDYGR